MENLSKKELIEKIIKLEESNSKIFKENLHLYLFLQTCASEIKNTLSEIERDCPFPYLIERNPAYDEYIENFMSK
ncbi:hypothetical protein [Flavobacterium sp. H4147]|uniref:hypothetical protein n=1 Tax=Flavobacterium sp. H4147 TaxID=3034149 RepID=UPI0023EBBAAB|nr:hypothetical protein [Flavobacterium sp. H4147]